MRRASDERLAQMRAGGPSSPTLHNKISVAKVVLVAAIDDCLCAAEGAHDDRAFASAKLDDLDRALVAFGRAVSADCRERPATPATPRRLCPGDRSRPGPYGG